MTNVGVRRQILVQYFKFLQSYSHLTHFFQKHRKNRKDSSSSFSLFPFYRIFLFLIHLSLIFFLFTFSFLLFLFFIIQIFIQEVSRKSFNFINRNITTQFLYFLCIHLCYYPFLVLLSTTTDFKTLIDVSCNSETRNTPEK